ncbi:Retrovirus-related Pol polyprotein from transposon TNT 1-94 [Vitis vinifera]|uniref:Retrovirus-related Pol polyprotein from transposon TNT 1-94 n=1 Tax=Vitis vinifera TaxID=29760 RepID=A0A438G0Q4_VITVI|nr:Retrovirus-related Pol polyprotein from transposon TNT 1-94 [Vitis vinifera]
MLYKRKENIREYIMEMFNLVTRLKALKLELSKDKLVHLVLISLPIQFSPFKISYNRQKEKWTPSELIAQCVQEDERLKQEKIESVHLASTSQGHGPFAKYLMECGIVPQYTMSRTPSQNGVAKRRNHTLKNMGILKGQEVSNEKKLDSRIVSFYFVGYSERSRGFKFYDLSTRSFFETGNAKFIENVELSRKEPLRKVVFEDESVSIPIIATGHVVEPVQVHEEVTQQSQEPQVQLPLRRSAKEMRSTISDEHVVYLQEHEFDIGLEDDPISVSQVKQSSNFEKWMESMKDEMKSMKNNGVWDLVELPEGVKPIGCKWIFKTKWDSKDNIVRHKAHLVAKGFTQKECIDYKETFSSVSSKDSFRIIMALVAHYDLELHQMDVKTTFLNGNIDKTIYMVQLENFESNDSKQLESTVDQCIYVKFSGSKFIILVLYVDDILLASSDVELLHETKDRSRGILGLSQKSYIDKVLSRFGINNCSPGDTHVAKGDTFSLHQCPRNELERKDMERFLYALVVGSLMYAQVCTRPDIAYIVGMLGRYLSNSSMDHWKKAKWVMRYLQRTKYYMLTYRRSIHLEIVGYSDSDFVGCLDNKRSTSGYIFILAGGAVSWKSIKQTLIASSTMEAEFIACYEASNYGI